MRPTRVRVLRADGRVDGDALQRQLDSIVSSLSRLADGPAGALASLPVDVLSGDVDPTGRLDARLGSVYFRIDTTGNVAALHLKAAAGTSGWRLVTVG